MKPTIPFTEIRSRRDSFERASRSRSAGPRTEYNYQETSAANVGGRCFAPCRSSFRSISDGYFKNEARNDFAAEAAFFCVIVMTAALPLFSGAMALLHLVRSIATI